MSLNIKDERTHQLVRDLARRTGKSQTAVVREAVERQLAELDAAKPDIAERRASIDEVVRAFQADLTEEDRERMRTADDWLYDEHGLPR